MIYEDDEILVEMGPHDDEIPELLLERFRSEGKPIAWQKLREYFSASIGEDRLRRALRQLVNEGKIIQLNRNTFAAPEVLPPELLEDLEYKRMLRGRWGYYGEYRRRAQIYES